MSYRMRKERRERRERDPESFRQLPEPAPPPRQLRLSAALRWRLIAIAMTLLAAVMVLKRL